MGSKVSPGGSPKNDSPMLIFSHALRLSMAFLVEGVVLPNVSLNPDLTFKPGGERGEELNGRDIVPGFDVDESGIFK